MLHLIRVNGNLHVQHGVILLSGNCATVIRTARQRHRREDVDVRTMRWVEEGAMLILR
jgi:hypothetical protein